MSINTAEASKLEKQKETMSEFSKILKRSLAFWTGTVVLSFVACAAAFIILLLSFSTNSTLAIFGAIFGIVLFALGLVVNAYTKRESVFLCKVKRTPLGYLLRARLSKYLTGLFSACCVIGVAFSVISIVLFATSAEPSWFLIAVAASLIPAVLLAVTAFIFYLKSRSYIISSSEIFDEIETEFAKKSHRI